MTDHRKLASPGTEASSCLRPHPIAVVSFSFLATEDHMRYQSQYLLTLIISLMSFACQKTSGQLNDDIRAEQILSDSDNSNPLTSSNSSSLSAKQAYMAERDDPLETYLRQDNLSLIQSSNSAARQSGNCSAKVRSARVNLTYNTLEWLFAEHKGIGYVIIENAQTRGYQPGQNVCFVNKTSNAEILCGPAQLTSSFPAAHLSFSTMGGFDPSKDLVVDVAGFLNGTGTGAGWGHYLANHPYVYCKVDLRNFTQTYNEKCVLDQVIREVEVVNTEMAASDCLALCELKGDFNKDGVVSEADREIWSNSYGASGSNLPADANNDGTVNSADYTVFRDNLGSSCE